MTDTPETPKPTSLTDTVTGLVGAYFGSQNIHVDEIPRLFQTIEQAVLSIGKAAAEPVADTKLSASEIKKSITPDGITSFLDGKVYKSLKRHLTTRGLTPAEYRQKYGLPVDYPMVAANYAAQRSELAKSMGLGQQRTKTAARRAA
ncbi:MucR family transcriptional regulator [Methylobacterium ajmalii]|uniref:MucR family transcriptional regulator n=1 Tax=Methylobacterium ajmalii TaxID=2738439 RepID=A0ABV0A338_9HYPH